VNNDQEGTMTLTIELDRDVPDRTKDILSALPGVDVRRGKGPNILRVDGHPWPLALVSGGLAPLATATAPMLVTLAGPDRLGFVVAERLPEHVRYELLTAGCAYADGTGAAHIHVPGLYLHIEGRPSRRQVAASTPPGMGVVAVRAIQSLLADPTRQWTARDLAEAAACSTGEAQRVLARLKDEGLVTAHGRTRALTRMIPSPGELLDWLATIPSARRIRDRQYAYLYCSDPAALVTTITAHAFHNELEYAFSGAAAARIFGSTVTTAIPVTMLRIAPSLSLADACVRLKAEPVDSGANIVLVSDFGEVGIHGRQFNGPAPVAPTVRVWLDMLGEPRGQDAAALFREAVIAW
jgi:hypothetical protein